MHGNATEEYFLHAFGSVASEASFGKTVCYTECKHEASIRDEF